MDHEALTMEAPPWRPSGVNPLAAPIEREPAYDLRWRPPRGPPQFPEDPGERNWKSISDQCRNNRIPGYTGFIPSAKAESVFGRTQANVGERSVYEQARRMQMRSTSAPGADAARRNLRSPGRLTSAELAATKAVHGDEHPLGRSIAGSVGNHWVPTIPGYGGFIPAKHAENICGGGFMQTCQMAGRAIAERAGPGEAGSGAMSEASSDRARLANHLREHCGRSIPGYAGHIPRVKSDSVSAATSAKANRLAADLAEDRIFNQEAHIRTHCAPQAPPPRQLRI